MISRTRSLNSWFLASPRIDEMPDRTYTARNHPPNFVDRLAAHWVELTLALLGVSRGVIGILSETVDNIATAIDRIPSVLGIVVAISMILGGGFWITAVVRRFRTLNQYYYVLRTGLVLTSMGWISYLLTAVMFKPQEVLTWSVTLVASVATVGLYAQSFLNERTQRKETPSDEQR